jgi:hypothetical protein
MRKILSNIKRLLVGLEDLLCQLKDYNEYCDYYSLKHELGCGNMLNKEYDEWYYQQYLKNKNL